MLTLTRASGTSLTIGNATVHVRIRCGQVVLSIDAPKDVPVLRDNAKQRRPK